MQNLLKQSWWVLAISGAASILFGILAFVWPAATLLVVALFFSAWLLVDGIFMIFTAARSRDRAKNWWVWLLVGILGVIAGALGLFAPAAAAAAMVLLLAAYAIVTGVMLIWIGIKVRKEITGEWMLMLAGALSVIFGAFVAWQPQAGLLGLVWAIATWAIVIGVLKLIAAFRARRYAGSPRAASAAA